MSGRDPLLQPAAAFLDDTGPARGGRNTRPAAIGGLLTAYLGTARTGLGAAATGAAVLAGAAAWCGLAQLEEAAPSTVLVVVALALAVGLLVTSVLLARRVLGTGATTLAALRRWHAVAPEVPVRGSERLTSGAGLLRLLLGGLSVLAGLGAIGAAVALGTLAWRVGAGVAAGALLAAGVLALTGWWRLRGILRSAGPQIDNEAFAPAPYAAAPGAPGYAPQPQQPWTPAVPAGGGAAHPPAPSGWQSPPTQPPVQPAPWARAPGYLAAPGPLPAPAPASASAPVPPGPAEQPPAQPWVPPPGMQVPVNPADTWGPPADTTVVPGGSRTPAASPPVTPAVQEPEPDVYDTRLTTAGVADTTLASRRPAAGIQVLLEDGTALRAGAVSLVGRDPQPRAQDADADRVVVVHPTVSKTHASFRVTADAVVVVDRASTNGVFVTEPGGERRRLTPWAEVPVAVGSVVLLGSYRIEVLGRS